MQTCIHCGRQLSPGMTVCPSCGLNVPPLLEVQASHPTSVTSSATQIPTYVRTVDKPGSSGIVTLIQPTDTYAKTLPLHRFASKKHKLLSYIILTVILMLTLLLVISVAGMFYYTEISRPAQLRTQATAMSQNMQRINLHNTAIAQIHATQSAITQNQATSTAAARSTAQVQHNVAQVQATTTSLQDLYTQSTSGHPALAMSLFYDTNANWDIYPTKDGGGCAFTENALHSRAFQTNYYSPCIAHATTFRNFALEIQMKIIQGDEGGIIFRSNTHDQDFYSFRVRSDGTYGLILTQNDGHTTPLIYDQSNLIKTGKGQTNTITIIAQGNIFYLYMNKHYMGSASDNTYSNGSIGIMAVDRKNQTDVAFNNLRVWKL